MTCVCCYQHHKNKTKLNWTWNEWQSVMFCVSMVEIWTCFIIVFLGKGSLERQWRRSGQGIVRLQPLHKRMVFRKRTLWFRMSMENLRLSVNDTKHLICAGKWHEYSLKTVGGVKLLLMEPYVLCLKTGTEAFPWPKMVQRALWTDRNGRTCF